MNENQRVSKLVKIFIVTINAVTTTGSLAILVHD